ncbi:MAG: hypothetical protein HY238_08630 [Acidobacteria bacterium]|nr:hypothetical protein [Acidobacteriota bacterium]
MNIDLMPWLIAWGILTTVVIALALYRTTLAAHDPPGLSLADAHVTDVQKQIEHRLVAVDRWGKALTVLSGAMILFIAALWSYQTYMKGFEVIGH